jgi:hypothetical protein
MEQQNQLNQGPQRVPLPPLGVSEENNDAKNSALIAVVPTLAMVIAAPTFTPQAPESSEA